MSSSPLRIEALPGEGRYAVTFRARDGSEQSVVAQVSGAGVVVAESGLPAGWTTTSPGFAALARAIAALDEARDDDAAGPCLADVDGGWDVGLGNVVLGETGLPSCTAHGAMAAVDEVWTCGDCGARAVLRTG